MAHTYKNSKVDLTATSVTTVYTVPTATTSIVKSILVSDDSGSGDTITLTITNGSDVFSLFKTKTISANGTLELNGNITVSGDWSDGGALTAGTNTVTFDGSGAQTITSGGSTFYSLTNNNTSGSAVSLSDAFVMNGSGTLTTNSGTTFSLNGQAFNSNSGTITNNGTFQLNGDETLSSATTIGGSGTTKFVDASGATLTTGFAGLADVEFNSSGQTFTLGEDMTYISGDVTIAAGTTLDASGSNYDISLTGNWSSSGTFTPQNGTVTFNGSSAQTISGTTNTFYL